MRIVIMIFSTGIPSLIEINHYRYKLSAISVNKWRLLSFVWSRLIGYWVILTRYLIGYWTAKYHGDVNMNCEENSKLTNQYQANRKAM